MYFIKIAFLLTICFLGYFFYSTLEKSPAIALAYIVFLISSFYFLLTGGKFYFKKIRKKISEEIKFDVDFFVCHPARMLVLYFLILAFIGSILLYLPISLNVKHVKFIDVFFTAISATCVTGLTSINVGETFSIFGKVIILLLMQLGGLGIMSIACVALHTIGKVRFSQEKFLLMDTDGESAGTSLKNSLFLILRVAFVLEIIGAILLSFFIYQQEGGLFSSIFKGIFTAVASFCNSGLSLNSNSLMAYSSNAGVLYTSAMLIILGGLSPLSVVVFSNLKRKEKVALQFKIAFVTTIFLLLVGVCSFIIFEWNNLFSGMSFGDKINNIFYMSASARTAGFNTVDITKMQDITYLIVCFLMFIGGSPGSTAGGIKTTTFAILVLAFIASVRNRRFIIVDKKEVRSFVVFRAMTIFFGALVILILISFMLLATQHLPTKDILFESVSAFATTGLSLDTTSRLDEIGKIIICFAMFLGRIGTLVSFSLITEDKVLKESKYPSAKINLT